MLRKIGLASALIVAALAAQASEPAKTAELAFAEKDYARAWELWQLEAKAGSVEAQSKLGLMYDLGLGVSLDTERAYRWYLAAAEAGYGPAQLNIGIMHDTGAGTAPDVEAAALWYARAAASGELRAAYNLGLLYQSGAGVPQNAALAEAWLAHASGAAGGSKLAGSGSPDAAPSSRPEAIASFRRRIDNRVEFIWTSEVSRPGETFRIEARGPDGEVHVVARDIGTTAIAVPLPRGLAADVSWRVVQTGIDLRERASNWWTLDGGEDGFAPPQVRVSFDQSNDGAEAFATDLLATLADAGVDAMLGDPVTSGGRSMVEYAFVEDRELAEAVASLLPAGTPVRYLAGPSQLAPEEISVRIVFSDGMPPRTAQGPSQ